MRPPKKLYAVISDSPYGPEFFTSKREALKVYRDGFFAARNPSLVEYSVSPVVRKRGKAKKGRG